MTCLFFAVAVFISQTISSPIRKRDNTTPLSPSASLNQSSNASPNSLPNIWDIKGRVSFLTPDSFATQRARSAGSQRSVYVTNSAPVLLTDGMTPSGLHRSVSPQIRARVRKEQQRSNTNVSSLQNAETKGNGASLRIENARPGSRTYTVARQLERNKESVAGYMPPQWRASLKRVDAYIERIRKEYPFPEIPPATKQTKVTASSSKELEFNLNGSIDRALNGSVTTQQMTSPRRTRYS